MKIGLPSTSVVPLAHFGGLIFGPFVGKEERQQDVALTAPTFLLGLAFFLKSSLINVIFRGGSDYPDGALRVFWGVL